jgi:hypothetical protein
MRRLTWIIAGALALSFASTPFVAWGAERVYKPAELVAVDRELDGSVVTLEGEAIGEDLHADADHRWVNLMLDGTAVGVWMSNEDAAAIENYGDYDTRGDVVMVNGVLNIACDRHGGEFDIHADSVQVAETGAPVEHPIEPWKAAAGAIGLAVAYAEIRLFRALQERRSR